MVFGLENVGQFFSWLYNGVISISVGLQLFFLMIFFFAIQIAFVYGYYRIFKWIFEVYPKVEYWVRRLTEAEIFR